MKKSACALLLLSGLAFSHFAIAETQVNVVGLFSGKAVLIINGGKPRTLTAGQTVNGVKLISADSAGAVLEVEGKRRQLGMGQAVSVAGDISSEPQSLTLYANSSGHHQADGQINGASVKFLVDTGATSVAMNSSDAKKAGIDYKKGESIPLQTASGTVPAYRVVINSLRLGALVLNQVDGVVVEGDSPPMVLLGMSALNRLDMKRDGISLTLTKKF
ncbi:hypothetical protein MTYP_01287 [Methylophilaceae bacterium]|nr:hypothetical protein MTYP_01287 [Methylophilaceae bacterium]